MLDLNVILKGQIQRISWTDRYSSFLRLRNENVAEHICYVALYAHLIALDMKHQYPEVQIDHEKVLSRALVHDLDETISGDINRPFKKFYPGLNDMIKRACEAMMLPILHEMTTCPKVVERLHTDMRDAKDKTLEGYIIHLADFMSVVSYLISEKRRGSTAILEDFVASNKDIEKLFLGIPTHLAKYLYHYVRALNEMIHENLTKDLTLEMTGP